MSARPASLGFTTPITFPMSAGDFAPVAASASAMIASISACASCCGRYAARIATSNFSLSARSWRAPFSNCSNESLRDALVDFALLHRREQQAQGAELLRLARLHRGLHVFVELLTQ
jgi:hypothetical protein